MVILNPFGEICMILKAVWEKCHCNSFLGENNAFLYFGFLCHLFIEIYSKTLRSLIILQWHFCNSWLRWSLSMWLDCLKHLSSNWNHHRIHYLLLTWENDIFLLDSISICAFYSCFLCLSFAFCVWMPSLNLVFGRLLLMLKKSWIHSELLLS